MPISVPKMVKCKKCKHKFLVMFGDIRPQRIVCPKCGHSELSMGI